MDFFLSMTALIEAKERCSKLSHTLPHKNDAGLLIIKTILTSFMLIQTGLKIMWSRNLLQARKEAIRTNKERFYYNSSGNMCPIEARGSGCPRGVISNSHQVYTSLSEGEEHLMTTTGLDACEPAFLKIWLKERREGSWFLFVL